MMHFEMLFEKMIIVNFMLLSLLQHYRLMKSASVIKQA